MLVVYLADVNDSFWSTSEPPPRPPRLSRSTCAEGNEAPKILSFNARSMKNRKTEADNFALFEHHDADICAVNETWLAPEIKNHEFVPREYVVLRKDRLGGRRAAGGVLLAIRPHLQPRRLQHLEGDAEVVWASVRAGRLLLLVGSAYRRPNADQEYNSALLRSLECAARQQHNNDGVLLMVDFNLDIKWDIEPPVVGVQPAEAFIDAFAEISFAQFVKTATRTTNTSAKIIDLLLCDVPALVVEAHVVPGISDHEAVVAKLAISVQKPINAPTSAEFPEGKLATFESSARAAA
ncbi:Hypothetical predicted protein [Cloeon dipterum]|uniref:Endonuclease/exonuclease/phosphatase domain-containing protein n=1 Tax=Cloeon dipterum TaxID=197152 RepID=A0A8S1E3T7_9INSE|nr:Hypothetical predicted protein [Cloeon dipterum]